MNVRDPVQFVKAAHIIRDFDITRQTLRRWADAGHIRCRITSTGRRHYASVDVAKYMGAPTHTKEAPSRGGVIYARVSSDHQRGDLERQIDDLKSKYPGHKVYRDIGSGLNFKRKGLQALLEHVYAGAVDEVVVAHRDRLCRFGAELLDFIFEKAGTKLVVCDTSRRATPSSELADDLLSVATVFVARENGLRSADNRRRRQKGETDAKRRRISQDGSEDTGVSHPETSKDTA